MIRPWPFRTLIFYNWAKWMIGTFLALLFSVNAFAFPEMVRYGYVNCTACHYSPTGGGILTEYGRAISKELLSAGKFFFENSKSSSEQRADSEEEKFLYGSVVPPKWLELGGDIRFIQLFMDTPTMSSARFIAMQVDLEARASNGKRLQVVGTIGRAEPQPSPPKFNEFFISRRHWLGVYIGPEDNKEEYQFRVGRFFPAYGLNIPEHTVVTRKNLGFDQSQETYNAEFSYLGEQWNTYATVILGRPDQPPDQPNGQREEGAALQAAYVIDSTYKVGANLYTGRPTGTSNRPRRSLAGVFGILGFSPHLFMLTEFDLVRSPGQVGGLAEFVKLDRELVQGFHVFGIQEYAKPTGANPGLFSEAYSLGIQYFPRTHWEFLGSYRKERDVARSDAFNDVFWLLAHYYL